MARASGRNAGRYKNVEKKRNSPFQQRVGKTDKSQKKKSMSKGKLEMYSVHVQVHVDVDGQLLYLIV